MALIQCPECDHAVSTYAMGCPQCGYPLAGTPHDRRAVYVVERTGKTWKLVRVLGWLVMALGAVILFWAWAGRRSGGEALGSWIGLAGAGGVWISKAGAWWYNG